MNIHLTHFIALAFVTITCLPGFNKAKTEAMQFQYVVPDTLILEDDTIDYHNRPMIEGEWFNTQRLIDEIADAKPVQENQLWGKWEIVQSVLYNEYEDEEPSFWGDMFNGYIYTFKKDKTYAVDAIIDTHGKWELRDNGHDLYLFNLIREDEEIHSLILDGDKLVFAIIDGTSYMYQELKRIKP
jgi:hypothetical protein